MADYLFIDENGQKSYLTTAEMYNKTAKRGLFLADKCREKGFNDDDKKEGLYCICQGEENKIKMTLFRRGNNIAITSRHRIDAKRHLKGICRHARDNEGKPYDSAYMIGDDGIPVYKIKDKIYEETKEDEDTYIEEKGYYDPNKKFMTPSEFIRSLLISCYDTSSKSGKELTSKYFYGTLVNTLISINGNTKDTFMSYLAKGKLTHKEEYKDNKIIIFGPAKKISQKDYVTRIDIKSNTGNEKYIKTREEHFKKAAESFLNRYGIELKDALQDYNVICFAITRYNSSDPLWLQFHIVSTDGCYCDDIYETKAYDIVNKFIKTNKELNICFYKPYHAEGGDYRGEHNLMPSAYIVDKTTGKKIALIEVFNNKDSLNDKNIKERKLQNANYPVIFYDSSTSANGFGYFNARLNTLKQALTNKEIFV